MGGIWDWILNKILKGLTGLFSVLVQLVSGVVQGASLDFDWGKGFVSMFMDFFPILGSLADGLYKIAWVTAALIAIFQIIKTFFTPLASKNSVEDPVKVAMRLCLALVIITLMPEIVGVFWYLAGLLYTFITEKIAFFPAERPLDADTLLNGDFLGNAYKNPTAVAGSIAAGEHINGLHAGVATFFLTIMTLVALISSFTKLVLEVMERYVVICIMGLISPMFAATLASGSSSRHFWTWLESMLMQTILVGTSSLFMGLALSAMYGSYSEDANLITTTLMVVAIATVGHKFDDFLNTMGFAAVRGGNFGAEVYAGMRTARNAAGDILGAGARGAKRIATGAKGAVNNQLGRSATKGIPTSYSDAINRASTTNRAAKDIDGALKGQGNKGYTTVAAGDSLNQMMAKNGLNTEGMTASTLPDGQGVAFQSPLGGYAVLSKSDVADPDAYSFRGEDGSYINATGDGETIQSLLGLNSSDNSWENANTKAVELGADEFDMQTTPMDDTATDISKTGGYQSFDDVEGEQMLLSRNQATGDYMSTELSEASFADDGSIQGYDIDGNPTENGDYFMDADGNMQKFSDFGLNNNGTAISDNQEAYLASTATGSTVLGRDANGDPMYTEVAGGHVVTRSDGQGSLQYLAENSNGSSEWRDVHPDAVNYGNRTLNSGSMYKDLSNGNVKNVSHSFSGAAATIGSLNKSSMVTPNTGWVDSKGNNYQVAPQSLSKGHIRTDSQGNFSAYNLNTGRTESKNLSSLENTQGGNFKHYVNGIETSANGRANLYNVASRNVSSSSSVSERFKSGGGVTKVLDNGADTSKLQNYNRGNVSKQRAGTYDRPTTDFSHTSAFNVGHPKSLPKERFAPAQPHISRNLDKQTQRGKQLFNVENIKPSASYLDSRNGSAVISYPQANGKTKNIAYFTKSAYKDIPNAKKIKLDNNAEVLGFELKTKSNDPKAIRQEATQISNKYNNKEGFFKNLNRAAKNLFSLKRKNKPYRNDNFDM